MSNRNFLRSAGYCLSAALLLAVATSAGTFAAPPDVPPGLAKKGPTGSAGRQKRATRPPRLEHVLCRGDHRVQRLQ